MQNTHGYFTYTIQKHAELKDVLRNVFMYGNYEEKQGNDNSGARWRLPGGGQEDVWAKIVLVFYFLSSVAMTQVY